MAGHEGARSEAGSWRLDPALEARFRVARLLGAGGMGTVYEALDLERGELVALKTLKSHDADSLYRFKREFRALSGLSHPNLVLLYELFATPTDWAFSMELVRGTSLEAWLAPEGQSAPPRGSADADETLVVATAPGRSETTTARVGRQRRWSPKEEAKLRSALVQFARGLAALHESGHVHRDVKPSNVLVAPDGRVVVLDFGVIAEFGPAGQREANVVGTPSYMAPEQAIPLDAPEPASDWYAFGVVLYELLTGRRPFLGDAREVIIAKRFVRPPSILDLAPRAPRDLVDLCNALLRVEPSHRPAGHDALERLGDRTVGLGGSSSVGGDVSLRPRELERLSDALAAARGGQMRAVLVGGPSGFGKTTLVEESLQEAAATGAIILRGRCYARESVPFKALDTLVDELSRWLTEAPLELTESVVPLDVAALVEAFPVLGRVPSFRRRAAVVTGHPDETRRRAFRALTEVLERISAHRTVVVFVDDLQWGDLESAPFFNRLFATRSAHVLFLGTFRDDESEWSPLLRGLREGIGPATAVGEIILAPLPQRSLFAIARSVLGEGADETLLGVIAERAHGSPYFALELARHARAESSRPPAGGEVEGEMASIQGLIRVRAAALSADARRLLETVAVAGAALDRIIIEQAAGVARSTTKPFIELVSAHFLKHAPGDRVDTIHDAVREAILAELAPPDRAELHRLLARTLENRGADALDIHRAAQHYFLAFSEGDRGADPAHVFAVCHEAARRAAASHAHDQAFEHVERARRVAAAASLPVSADFHRFCGETAGRTGQVDAAIEALTALLPSVTDPVTRAQLRLARARVLLARLDAVSSLDEALVGVLELGEAPPRSPAREVASMLRRTTTLLVRARIGLDRDVDADTAARRELRNQLWFQYGLSGYFRLDTRAQLSAIVRSVDIVVRAAPSAEGVRWYAMCAVRASMLRLTRLARALRAAAERTAGKVGTAEARAIAMLFRGHSLNFSGEPCEAERVMRDCLDTYGHALSNLDFHLLMSHLVGILMVRGHAQTGLRFIEQGLERASMEVVGHHLDNRHTYACYRAVMLAMLGRADEGRGHLDSFGGLVDGTTDRWRRVHWLALRVIFLAESGAPSDEVEAAAAELRADGMTPRTLPPQFRFCYAAIARKRLAELDGSPAARRRFLAAREDLERCAAHPALQTKLLCLDARFARIEGNRESAGATLAEARALATEIEDPLALFDVALEEAALEQSPAPARAHLDRAERLAREQGWEPRLAVVTKLRAS